MSKGEIQTLITFVGSTHSECGLAVQTSFLGSSREAAQVSIYVP